MKESASKRQKYTWMLSLLSVIVVGSVISFFVSHNNSTNYSANAATAKPSKVYLKIEDLKISKGPTGAIDVTGKVINNSTKNVQDVKLTASYYDNTNSLLGKTIKFLSNPSENIKPNGKLDFNFVETVTFTRIAHSIVNATANLPK
jgi:hypothetical protein